MMLTKKQKKKFISMVRIFTEAKISVSWIGPLVKEPVR